MRLKIDGVHGICVIIFVPYCERHAATGLTRSICTYKVYKLPRSQYISGKRGFYEYLRYQGALYYNYGLS